MENLFAACPLCSFTRANYFFKDHLRRYFYCPECFFVFADPAARLSHTEEKAYYDLHENDPSDAGYIKFLSRFANPLVDTLKSMGKNTGEGLDFGTGSSSPLPKMLEQQGYFINVYDLHYANNPRVLQKKYDFITCTEVLEHLHKPSKELAMLLGLLSFGGILGIMTKMCFGQKEFKTWHYKNDPTHVSFFSQKSFLFFAKKHKLGVNFFGNDVIFLRKF